MSLTVIDYSDQCLDPASLRQPRRGKFVVLRDGTGHHAAFAPSELAAYHANIVERFLRDVGVGGAYNRKGDVYHAGASHWKVEGGGHWEFDPARGVVGLCGASLAYGGLDLEAFADELRQTGAFDGAEVIVRH